MSEAKTIDNLRYNDLPIPALLSSELVEESMGGTSQTLALKIGSKMKAESGWPASSSALLRNFPTEVEARTKFGRRRV
jgi:hypothetical protein